MPVSSFQGMTDILLCTPSNITLLRAASLEECVCCVEVGIQKETTFPLAVGTMQKRWPQKVGELLASMHYYGTLWYLNQFTNLPTEVKWTAYGLFTLQSVGCLLLKMSQSKEDFLVELLHEGGCLSLGTALEAVVQIMK